MQWTTLCLKKGTPMLSIVTLKRINGLQRVLAQIFLTQPAIKWWFNFPPHPTSASTLPGENRTNEICIEMDKKRQQMEVISHKNLTTVVWTDEVHRLLTIVLVVKQRTVTRLADVRVSAGQRTNASGAWKWNDRTVGAQNPRLHLSGWSVALQQPWPQSSQLQAPGGTCNSGSIRWRSRMWMNSWSNWLTSGLVWSRTLLTLLSTNGETVCVLVFTWRANILNIYCRQLKNWTIG